LIDVELVCGLTRVPDDRFDADAPCAEHVVDGDALPGARLTDRGQFHEFAVTDRRVSGAGGPQDLFDLNADFIVERCGRHAAVQRKLGLDRPADTCDNLSPPIEQRVEEDVPSNLHGWVAHSSALRLSQQLASVSWWRVVRRTRTSAD
jgi:hypothetical protein